MQKLNFKPKNAIIICVTLLFTVYACNKEEETIQPSPPETVERGEISKTTNLGTYTPAEIQQIYDASNVPVLFDLKFAVNVVAVSYYTIDGNGDQIVTSGAFLIPKGKDNLPMLTMPHGTETKRDKVASVSPMNSTEGIVGLMTASMGYFSVLPDYPGFGVSNIMHPYIHAKSLIPCVVDFMRAGKSYALNNEISLDDRVFLTGYSEGGYITLATQKTIEENYLDEFNLIAIAPLAGPYDVNGMTDSIFISNGHFSSAYAAYFLTAYNELYGWNRLDDFFSSPYNAMMPTLFDGSKTWGEIINQLPPTYTEIMNPEFILNYNNGNEVEIIAALQENTILDWTPHAPIHFFHGDADSTVPYQNVLTAIEKFTTNGVTDVQLTTIAGGTHDSAGPEAIFGAIAWFESF